MKETNYKTKAEAINRIEKGEESLKKLSALIIAEDQVNDKKP